MDEREGMALMSFQSSAKKGEGLNPQLYASRKLTAED